MSLSEQMIQALTWMEQCFWENGGTVPTDEATAEATGIRVETIRSYWDHEDFRIAAAARGIDSNNRLDSNPRALTFEQLMVANMLMNIHDRRSLREKLKDPALEGLGVTPSRVQVWMRQPAFQEHLKRRANDAFDGAEHIAKRELIRLLEDGDLKAITLYFEMRGIYNPRVHLDVNINVVIARVVEIVTKHVKDPVILSNIASDIEALEIGGPVVGSSTESQMTGPRLSALKL